MRRPSSSNFSLRRSQGSRRIPGLLANSSLHGRLRIWAFLLILLMSCVSVRLLYLQIFRHSYYKERAKSSHVREWQLPAPRGTIYDRNGNVLAINIPRKSVFIDPGMYATTLENASKKKKLTPEQRAEAQKIAEEKFTRLAKLLHISPDDLRHKLNQPGRFVMLKRFLPEEVATEIASLKLSWVGLKNEDKRTYPYGTMAAQTLGFTGDGGKGWAGLEASYNKLLGGQPGLISLEVDGQGRSIPNLRETRVPGKPGADLTLTIDASLQQVAESALAEGITNASAAGGVALVMDPNNGEILALASQPAFDPNDYRKSPRQRWTNPAVVGAYEPGSTFKIVAACATLEEGTPESAITLYCSGEKAIGKQKIHCALHNGSRAHGEVNLEKMIEKSCNVSAATLAMRLGKKKFAGYVKAMGFGQKTGIELASETPGQVAPAKKWSEIQLANIGFGQGITVTPLQLLRSYCIIANGGRFIQPHLVKKPISENAGKRVLSEQTAATMRQLFVQVVESGTGKAAQVQDYLVAGKTGTSQKPVPGIGYRSGKYIGSFVGFVPADKPKVAILVLIDEPRGSYYGGVIAAPVFQAIARHALLNSSIPPSHTDRGNAAADDSE